MDFDSGYQVASGRDECSDYLLISLHCHMIDGEAINRREDFLHVFHVIITVINVIIINIWCVNLSAQLEAGDSQPAFGW